MWVFTKDLNRKYIPLSELKTMWTKTLATAENHAQVKDIIQDLAGKIPDAYFALVDQRGANLTHITPRGDRTTEHFNMQASNGLGQIRILAYRSD